ncbi:MAG TPA: hypothetical protein GXX23_09290 [Firmicutes bacterium]|nr:hypothetical protein [Candidatus Fermentithermobacillaceae bacterium]
MDVPRLIRMARETPVGIPNDLFLRLRLPDECNVFPNAQSFREALNGHRPMPNSPTLIVCESGDRRVLEQMSLPFEDTHYDFYMDPAFNDVLCMRYEFLRSLATIPKQSQVPRIFVELVKRTQPRVAVIMVIDGLSYGEARDFIPSTPCLVDGLSLTREGMLRIVGSPTLAERLFSIGYRSRIGFSYWDRHNDLGNEIFRVFATDQSCVVKSLDDALMRLAEMKLEENTFVQIVRSGLDSYAHHHLDRPPVHELTAEICADIRRTAQVLASMADNYLLLVTSDHGILWEDTLATSSILPGGAGSPIRYYSANESVPQSMRKILVAVDEDGHKALPIRYLRRALGSREWGCHGGISVHESFVPIMVLAPDRGKSSA